MYVVAEAHRTPYSGKWAFWRLTNMSFLLGSPSLQYSLNPAHVSVGAKRTSRSHSGYSALFRPASPSARRCDAPCSAALTLYYGEKCVRPGVCTFLKRDNSTSRCFLLLPSVSHDL